MGCLQVNSDCPVFSHFFYCYLVHSLLSSFMYLFNHPFNNWIKCEGQEDISAAWLSWQPHYPSLLSCSCPAELPLGYHLESLQWSFCGLVLDLLFAFFARAGLLQLLVCAFLPVFACTTSVHLCAVTFTQESVHQIYCKISASGILGRRKCTRVLINCNRVPVQERITFQYQFSHSQRWV